MPRYSRRRLLEVSGVGISGFFAGCSSGSPSPGQTTGTQTPTRSTAQAETSTETETTTPPTTERSNTIFVDGRHGSATGTGSEDDPVQSIQYAIRQAQPGQTVYIKPGEYPTRYGISTVRDGEPGAPITITGPRDAVIRPLSEDKLFRIKHSHIHLTGLTFDGLRDPANPDSLSSYCRMLIACIPPRDSNTYLENVVISPYAVGNTQRSMVVVNRTKNLEIGSFTVIGRGGAYYTIGGQVGHAGEVVYLGTPPASYGERVHPWTELDQTRNVHIHHIDNSAGHPHSELVNTKMGTRNVLIEYCTDGGGSQNNESRPSASVRLQSYDTTLRWCDLRNGSGYGVHVQARAQGYLRRKTDPAVSSRLIGTGHSIYGNRISGFDDAAISFNATTPAEQKIICGNEISGTSAPGSPGKSCPVDLPKGDGVGSSGGNNPRD